MSKLPRWVALFSNPNSNFQQYKILFQCFIWILTYLVYACSHSARKPLSVVKNVLSPTNTTAGWAPFDKLNYKTLLGGLDSSFLFSYAFGMLFLGHSSEKLGIIRVLSVTNFLASIFTVLFGIGYFCSIHNYWYYFVIQFLCGLSMSASWPGLIGVFSNWSGIKLRGLITGIWSSNSSVGNIVGTVIASAFVSHNWGWSFVVPGLVLLFITIIMSTFLIERPDSLDIEINKYQPIQNEDDLSDQPISVVNLLKIPNIISFGVASFFLKLTSYTLLYWLPVYLLSKSNGKLNPKQAGEMSTFYDVGSVFGVSIAGLITDFLGKRRIMCLILCCLACPSLFLLNFYQNVSYYYSAFMLALIGFFINGCFGLLVTTISIDLSQDPSIKRLGRCSAAITGFLDGVGSVGAAVGPILSGYLSTHSWDYFFYLIISSVGICLLILIRPTVMEFRRSTDNI